MNYICCTLGLLLVSQEAVFNRPKYLSGGGEGLGRGCYLRSQNVSGLWLDVEEEATTTND